MALDFQGISAQRKFGPSRLGMQPGLANQAKLDNDARAVKNAVQEQKRTERLGRRAYRAALRGQDPTRYMQGMDALEKMRQIHGSSGAGIRMAGSVEEGTANHIQNTRNELDAFNSFKRDLGNSELIRSGDEGALSRAVKRGAAFGLDPGEVRKMAGVGQRSTSQDPAPSATAPSAPETASSLRDRVSGTPATPGKSSLLDAWRNGPQAELRTTPVASTQPISPPTATAPQATQPQYASLEERVRAGVADSAPNGAPPAPPQSASLEERVRAGVADSAAPQSPQAQAMRIQNAAQSAQGMIDGMQARFASLPGRLAASLNTAGQRSDAESAALNQDRDRASALKLRAGVATNDEAARVQRRIQTDYEISLLDQLGEQQHVYGMSDGRGVNFARMGLGLLQHGTIDASGKPLFRNLTQPGKMDFDAYAKWRSDPNRDPGRYPAPLTDSELAAREELLKRRLAQSRLNLSGSTTAPTPPPPLRFRFNAP